MSREDSNFLHCFDIPQADRAIGAGRGQGFPVREKIYRADPGFMPATFTYELSSLRVPDLDAGTLVSLACGQPGAIGGKRDSKQRVCAGAFPLDLRSAFKVNLKDVGLTPRQGESGVSRFIDRELVPEPVVATV